MTLYPSCHLVYNSHTTLPTRKYFKYAKVIKKESLEELRKKEWENKVLERQLTETKMSKENELARLQDVVQKSKKRTKQVHNDLKILTAEKTKLLTTLSAKQKEITEQTKLIQVQSHQSREYQISREKQISEAREVARLRENELQKQLHDCGKKESEIVDLKQQLTEINASLDKANSTVKLLTDENVQLRSDISLLNETLENTLKSKDETITILQSEWSVSLPLYNDQKQTLQPLTNKVTDVKRVACGSLKDGGSTKVPSFPLLGASAGPLSVISSFEEFKLNPTKGFSFSKLPTVSSASSQSTTRGSKLEGFLSPTTTSTVSSALFQPTTTRGFKDFSIATGPPKTTPAMSTVLFQPTTGEVRQEGFKGFSTIPTATVFSVSSPPSQSENRGFKLEGFSGPATTTPTVSSTLFQPTTTRDFSIATGPPKTTPAISNSLSQFPSFPSQPGLFDFTTCPPVSGKINLLSTVGVQKSRRKGESEGEGAIDKKQAEEKPKEIAAFSFSQLAATQSGFNFDRPSVTEPVLKPVSPRKTGKGGIDEDNPEKKRELHFKPLVSLPKLRTGEENDEVIFCHRAKLFRFNNNQWKERGTGEMKILKNKTTNRYRCVMRHNQILKLCCNHCLSPEMVLSPFPGSKKAWMWCAYDFADEDAKSGTERITEKLAICFKTPEIALEFKSAFESGCKGEEHNDMNKIRGTEKKTTDFEIENEDERENLKETLQHHTTAADDQVDEEAEEKFKVEDQENELISPSMDQVEEIEEEVKMKDKQDDILFSTLHTTNHEANCVKEKSRGSIEVTPPNLGAIPTGGYFSKAPFNFQSFADLAKSDDNFDNSFNTDSNFKFAGADCPLFSSHTTTADEKEGRDNPKEEATIHFKPVVTLPERYEYKSGEENGEVLFNEKGKLYCYDGTVKQWKERGIGNMKILRYSETGQTRLIMRQDQILKLCCNHYLTSEMTIETHMNNPKAYKWFTKADYSKEVGQPDQFIIRFKLVETAVKFKELFEKGVEESSKLVEKSPAAVPFVGKKKAL